MLKHALTKIILISLFLAVSFTAKATQFNVLVFTKTDGFHHAAINPAVTAFRKMASKHHFYMEWHEDASKFNDDYLSKIDAVVFLLTTGDILNKEQQAAMERFIQSGKGFVGVHSAADTEYSWPWFTQLVGRNFHIHPPTQTAEINVIKHNFPGVERMPSTFLWTDEYYEYGKENIKGLNYILSVDEKTFDPNANWPDANKSGNGMGDFHPIAWYHEFDGGRSFYTGLGHVDETYQDDLFLEHVFGGLYWAATGKGIRKK